MKTESMKRAAALIGLSLVVVLISSASAFAQTILRGHVPFPFAVGDVWLPAGDYVIRYDKDWLRMQTGGKTHIFVARQDFAPDSREPKLNFKMTDGSYRLCKVPGLLTKYCK